MAYFRINITGEEMHFSNKDCPMGTRGTVVAIAASPRKPVMWTKSSGRTQHEDVKLRQNESLHDLDFVVAQLC